MKTKESQHLNTDNEVVEGCYQIEWIININKSREDQQMKNTLGDLNNHLFAQLERLGDEGVKGDALKEEIERARTIANIAKQIIGNANIVLKAEQLKTEYCKKDTDMPKMLEG